MSFKSISNGLTNTMKNQTKQSDQLFFMKKHNVPHNQTHKDGPKKVGKTSLVLESETDEMERVKRRIQGFNYKSSHAWKMLTAKYGPKLAHEELMSIAELLSAQVNINLDRDAKRRKAVLVKWFEENWDSIQGYLQYVILESDD